MGIVIAEMGSVKKLLLLFVFSVNFVHAQLMDTSIVVQGEKFCFHKIQQGETMFQLSRVYDCAFSVIKAHNPDKNDDLAIGDTVKLPCKCTKQTSLKNLLEKNTAVIKQSAEESLPKGYILHQVKAKETFYSLTKKYNTTELQLKKDNPSLVVLGLRIGDQIKIFVGEEAVTSKTDSISKDSSAYVPKHQWASDTSKLDSAATVITVLLPFNWDKNKQQMLATEEGDPVKILPYTSYFLDFYKGLEMGLDSLNKLGKSYQVFVFDTKADSNVVKSLVQRRQVRGCDLMIGPAYPYNIKIASKALQGSNVKLLTPYGKEEGIAVGRSNVIRIQSNKLARVTALSRELFKSHKHDQIILVHQNEQEKVLVEKLQEELLGMSMMNDTNVMRTPVIVKGVYEPLSKLDIAKRNVVVSFTTKESFATKLVAKLQTKHREYNITIFGMQEWKDYKNIEMMHWDSLGIHLVGNLDYRFTGFKSKSLFENYFRQYYSEPSYDALLAYDLCFAILAPQSKVRFSVMDFAGKPYVGELSSYYFKFNGPGNGLENRAATVFKYKNYKFEKINE